MKAFALSDESASLYLNKEWETQETGLDNLMIAGNSKGTDAIFMFQFPKYGIYPVETIDDMRDIIDESFQISNEEETEAFDIPGMSNVSAMRCKVAYGGANGEACIVYGETDYAFYAIGYIGNRWKDSTMASFRASCINLLNQRLFWKKWME